MSRAARVALWVAAAGLTWLFARWDLPAPEDRLRNILLAVPLTVAALKEIELGSRRSGGRRLSRLAGRFEGAMLVALVLTALGRHHLGLRFAEALLDPVIVAGFVVLLAHRTARLVIAARPSLGEGARHGPPALFFLLPLVVYLALVPWSTSQRPPNGDEPYYLLLAHSLVHDLDVELGNEYEEGVSLGLVGRRLEPQPGDPVRPDGGRYSRHGALLPLVLAPAYAAGGKLGALAMMAALTAALAWMFLRVAGAVWPTRPGGALLAWSVFAFAPPVLVYSYQVWSEVPAALLALLAIDRIVALRSGSATRRDWLLLGLALALLIVLKQRFVLIVGPAVLLAWWWAPRFRRRVALLAGLLALTGAGFLVQQHLAFGHALRVYDWGIIGRQLGKPPLRAAESFTGQFLDSGFGLAASAPIWLLLVPAVLLAARRHRRVALGFLLLCGPSLLVVSLLSDPTGGWAPPFRFGFVTLPFLALLLVPLLDRRRPGARALFAGLALATLLVSVLWVVFPNWTYSFADGRNHLLDHLGLRYGLDFARFFPSAVRPRLATWIWPPAALALAALWWVPGRPRWGGTAVGASAVLLGAALLLSGAAGVPTRVIELEDPHVEKNGGTVDPRPWVPHRIRYRGGWRLRAGDSLSAPVQAGGSAVDLEIDYRAEGKLLLRVREGSRLVAEQLVEGHEWATLRLDTTCWTRGSRLVLEVVASTSSRGSGSVVLDRARTSWGVCP